MTAAADAAGGRDRPLTTRRGAALWSGCGDAAAVRSCVARGVRVRVQLLGCSGRTAARAGLGPFVFGGASQAAIYSHSIASSHRNKHSTVKPK